jgi:ABC-type multidrug transport system ATPase subunit
VLVLDEPAAGLDPEQAEELRGIIKSLRKQYTIMLFSHNINEIVDICGSMLILRGGEIAAIQTTQSLISASGALRRITVRLSADKQRGLSLLERIEGADFVQCVGCNEAGTCDFVVETTEADTRARIFEAAAKEGITLLGMNSLSVTLEDIVAQISGTSEEASK